MDIRIEPIAFTVFVLVLDPCLGFAAYAFPLKSYKWREPELLSEVGLSHSSDKACESKRSKGHSKQLLSNAEICAAHDVENT